MEKILTLVNGDRTTILTYKTTSAAKTGMLYLLIDLIAILIFQKWIWIILVWTWTTFFHIKKIEEIETVKTNVCMLINQGWMPRSEQDRILLINDFKLNENLFIYNAVEAKIWENN